MGKWSFKEQWVDCKILLNARWLFKLKEKLVEWKSWNTKKKLLYLRNEWKIIRVWKIKRKFAGPAASLSI